MTDAQLRWQDFSPQQAADQKINLSVRLDITAPLDENGERCPWPWEPQQLVNAPIGQYHCPWCGAMVIAGMEHLDYSTDEKLVFLLQQASRKVRMDKKGIAYFECPDCHTISPNPDDIANKYCSNCHQFKGDPWSPTG